MEDVEIKSSKLRENLETQIMELDMLESMFYKPGELKVDDLSALKDIKKYINQETEVIPPFLDLTINVTVDDMKLEVCINLSHEYPDIEPDIFVRNHKLNRNQHTTLNRQLFEHVSTFKGEQCIFNAISWLQDNIQKYFDEAPTEPVQVDDKKKKPKHEKMVRYWIYSHHIYSKTKRREILSLANTLSITGFCMPGKPGIICVEGDKSDCDEWWTAIKSMTWKRIFCKVTEDIKNRKFETFEEVSFPNHGMRSNHMDLSELYKYLEGNSCAYIFKDLFGVDNKDKT
ncbi:Protein of unknown function (DUF1115) [Popillia japonica]|uniref:RWD domain-containing protein n=1 Tax=Popillia japonica TaxID=7064 RepID=A0AAW1JC75_POPJA